MVTVSPRRVMTPAIPLQPDSARVRNRDTWGSGPAVTWTRRSSLLYGMLPSEREENLQALPFSKSVPSFFGSGRKLHSP